MDQDDEPAIHALVIGIDHCPPGDGEGPRFRGLGGCVADARDVAAYLRDEQGVPAERITLLVSPHPVPGEPPPDPSSLPTAANIVARWQALIDRVPAGDQLYFHFSGHGARVRTRVPEVKGDYALDEALVPCDVHAAPGGRYLRDVEIACLIERMVDKGIVATMVIDSCHAAGIVRAADAVARCADREDARTPREPSSVGPHDELVRIAAARVARGAATAWPVAAGAPTFTLIAACQPSEYAYEYRFDGGPPRGALSYFWLEVLRRRWPSLSYGVAHQQILAEVRRRFERQSPALFGDPSRVVLGHGRARPPRGLAIVDVVGERIRIAGGAAGRIAPGMVFAAVPLALAAENVDLRGLPQFEVDRVDDTEAWATRLPERGGNGAAGGAVEPGAQAVLVRHDAASVHNVHLAASPWLDGEARALTARVQGELADRLARAGDLVMCDASRPADLIVDVEAHGDELIHVVCDPAGQPLPNLGPPIDVRRGGDADAMVRRVMHVARYRNVHGLANRDRRARLSTALHVELRDEHGAPLASPARFTDGDPFTLRVENRGTSDMHVTVLDLQPDWAITVLAPSDGDQVVLSPRTSHELDLVARLPPTCRDRESLAPAIDTLKVIATRDPVDLRWLSLPAIGGASSERRAARHAVLAVATTSWYVIDVMFETRHRR